MKKLLSTAASAILLVACGPHSEPAQYVDPFIGTDAHGHTFPGATTPFGMVQLSPDTDTEGWDWCSGYHSGDSSIIGFSHTHLSGTGGADLGDILLMPGTGPVKFEPGTKADPDAGYRSRFSHKSEKARAGYYSVYLDDPRVKAELTATPHTGVHRYTFGSTTNQHIIIDLRHGIQDNVHSAAFRQVDDHTIEGWRRSNGWAADHTVFFRAEFSEPIREIKARIDSADTVGIESGEGERVVLAVFPGDHSKELEVRVGISPVSLDGAAANLAAEASGRKFDKLADAAGESWNRELSKVEVSGGSDEDKKIFYTALYHAFTAPYLFTDVDGHYRGADGEVHAAASADALPNYTLYSTWDTFRALHPLLTLVQPEVNQAVVRSMLRYYEQTGRLPVWDLHMNENNCMIGYHSVPIIADAYLKGQLPDSLGALALEAMVQSAMQDGYGGLPYYRQLGYLPSDKENNSVSKAVEYAYDDWCIAQMAKALGKDSLYNVFIRRAQYYKNHFDPQDGFFKGRSSTGQFHAPFDPSEISILGQGDFTEGNAWHYRFFVPQDVNTHIEMLGGDSAYMAAIDAMFDAPSTEADHSPDVSGLIGQYAHGNEPSHQVAYLYSFAGAPWRTQERVAEIKRTMYTSARDGLCGNEDCGQMSAWYVLSAMGFYPVTPGSGIYVLGTPTFKKTVIRLPEGKKFTIEAKDLTANGKNLYIQSAELDGEPYTRSYITHDLIEKGGRLVLHMGDRPNKEIGAAETDRPVSRIPEDKALTSERMLEGIVFEPYLEDSLQVFGPTVTVHPRLFRAQPGTRVVYTTDGSEPKASSAVAGAGGIVLTRDTDLKLRAVAPHGRMSNVKEYRFYKSVLGGAKVMLEKEPSAPYANGGAAALVDYAMGGNSYIRPQWVGFNGDNLAGVIDMGRVRSLSHVGFNAANEPGSWIVLPRDAIFEFSTDGVHYVRPVAITTAGSRTAGSGAHYFGTAIPGGVQARYIRFVIRNGELPDWHIGKGNPSWMFVDEITAY